MTSPLEKRQSLFESKITLAASGLLLIGLAACSPVDDQPRPAATQPSETPTTVVIPSTEEVPQPEKHQYSTDCTLEIEDIEVKDGGRPDDFSSSQINISRLGAAYAYRLICSGIKDPNIEIKIEMRAHRANRFYFTIDDMNSFVDAANQYNLTVAPPNPDKSAPDITLSNCHTTTIMELQKRWDVDFGVDLETWDNGGGLLSELLRNFANLTDKGALNAFDQSKAKEGDVIIFFEGNFMTHSGTIVKLADGTLGVYSKFGVNPIATGTVKNVGEYYSATGFMLFQPMDIQFNVTNLSKK